MPRENDIPIEKKHWKDIVLLRCGTHRCDSGHIYGPIRRQFYLVHFIFSGTGVFRNERDVYHLGKGQAFIIRPGEVTSYEASQDTPWYYGWLGFSCSDPLPMLNSQDVFDLPELKQVFSQISSSMEISLGREWYLLGLIAQMLTVFADATATEGSRVQHNIRRAKFNIETNYMHRISIQELATNLHMDRSYFSAMFKKEVGCSPQQYLIRCRMENAAAMLTEQNMRSGEVARMVGYPDEFSFSRAFRKAYGFSPSQYQKMSM